MKKGKGQRSRILLIEDDPAQAEVMVDALHEIADKVEHVITGASAFATLAASRFDLILIDIGLPDVSGFVVLRWIRGRGDTTPIVFVTADDLVEHGVEAMRRGANDYVVKKEGYVRKLVEASAAVLAQPRKPPTLLPPADPRTLEGTSPAIETVRELIREYAATDATVLIRGETGTGKELVAREIHGASPRSKGPFVPVNCAAIPEQLLESEFFGYKRGAFTGAESDRKGLFKSAEGGTLFLDEIGELSLCLQGKLLRVIETGTFRPVGGLADETAILRVIAATNRDLRRLCPAGQFREDLYYRLNVLSIHVPPLRERREDIPILAESFLGQYAPDRQGGSTGDAIAQLMAAPWPGNVRELEHVVQRTVVRCGPGPISRFEIDRRPAERPVPRAIKPGELIEALAQHRGRLKRVAESLGVSLRTVQRRMSEYGINKMGFRKDAS